MKKLTTSLLFGALFFTSFINAQTPNLDLVSYASGFSRPVGIANAGDERLFVIEQHTNLIRIIDGNGNVLQEPFLDLNNLAYSSGDERGLLGLAFHPNYEDNGYLFVNYSRLGSGDTYVCRFERDPNDPNKALINSEKLIIAIDQPYSNHNGGDLKFGPDGYLYIAMGDGGSSGDPDNHAQTKTSLLGKMLRLDIDNGNPYSIPDDNPFVSDPSTNDRIWSLGLRNPWRFSFDRLTGDMWIGDVGQRDFEEVDFEEAGNGGLNYGWRCYEGNDTYNTSNCNQVYTDPVYDFASNYKNRSCSVIGGYVYRGKRWNLLEGYYIFTDYCHSEFEALKSNGSGGFDFTDFGDIGGSTFSTFGEDQDGELYVAGLFSGVIYKFIDANCADFEPMLTINGSELSVTEGSSYDLYRDGELFLANQTGSITITNTGNYYAVVTSENGCKYTTGSQDIVLSTSEVERLAQGIHLFPNPASTEFTIQNNNSESIDKFEIYNELGILMGENKLTSSTQKIPCAHLEEGTYHVKLYTKNNMVIKKISIK